jgi:hypothetical protein
MKNGNGQTPPQFLHSELTQPEIKKYYDGKWWWQKSHETYRMDHPFRRLLNANQREVFDVLTCLCLSSKSWILRVTPEYLSRACGGKPAKRTIEGFFAFYRKLNLLQLRELDYDRGNIYLVSNILMGTEKASEMRFFLEAEELSRLFRALDAPAVKPQRRMKAEMARIRATMDLELQQTWDSIHEPA